MKSARPMISIGIAAAVGAGFLLQQEEARPGAFALLFLGAMLLAVFAMVNLVRLSFALRRHTVPGVVLPAYRVRNPFGIDPGILTDRGRRELAAMQRMFLLFLAAVAAPTLLAAVVF